MAETPEPSEVDKVIGACKARLAAPEEWKPFPGYPDSLPLTRIVRGLEVGGQSGVWSGYWDSSWVSDIARITEA